MPDRSARPRLVLVHGTRIDARQWEPYRALLPQAEIVAPDLPGHGSRVGEEFTLEAAVATIAAAVEGAAPGQRVVLAGHSLGGYMAMVHAAQHSDRLAALVLVGATADPSGPLTAVYRGFAALVGRSDPERLARRTNRMVRWLGAGDQVAEVLPGGEAYAALPAAWQAVMDACGPDLLRDVTCPVVLVNGQYDQMRLHVRQFAAAAPRATVVTVPRATHLLPLTHPEELARILAGVLVPRGDPGPLPTMGA
ncbi:pimeloyl-ACP methyl ester carboxylesterase [Ornithinimicrobium humiphilum]|uniref:Pimeloyl-ACP methyl ester carboxylesterase n=1 Tax=Ornithinimicrobium humiphilum TaxID=125288 RepID=A0A543KR67_9MICO|nr:alpha/beta hydrolase [Ornithinimicrobium humiphilum]TQM97550.1 pimeloyl-ACP methyl ester carboxylesterase [Ornithinimicrobium humiphilum]